MDRLREQSVAAYAGWLDRARTRGEIVLPAPLEVAVMYVDSQFTMLLTKMAAGEDREMVRAHAGLAFAALTSGGAVDA